jgi:hypothetical protein
MTERCQTSERDCPFDAVKWGQMIEKLDNIHADVLETKVKVEKQNGRVRKLENWRWYLLGAFAATLFILKILKVQI